MPHMTLPLPTPPSDAFDDVALFLDFDGTLVELAPTPDSVQVDPALAQLLDRLQARLSGRLAVVSGRGAAEVAGLLGSPALMVSGSHGLERRTPDGRITAPAGPELAAVLARLEAFASRHPGVLVEPKPFGAGLHYRRAPEAADAANALARELADAHGLVLQPGKMVAELRVGGADKGSAIAALMEEPDWKGARPVFLGDDVTDEAGFHAVATLGGAGVLVGPERDTAARWRLPDVAAVHAWLAAAAA